MILGIGDDAAVLRAPRGEDLVATVDAVVENVHFNGAYAPAEVGWKSLAVNLSDIAAMGARPLWALCALATPPERSPRWLAALGRGLAECAAAYDTVLVGGNVTGAPCVSVTITVLGAVPRGKAITRAGARPGDLVFVSGTVGDAALGLEPGAPRALVARQRRPVPRIALGMALRGVASAGLDVSDGVVQDLGHMCELSGVGARVRVDRLPLSRAYEKRVATRSHAYDAALSGGEDYELLVAVPPRRAERARAAARALALPLTEIGEITRGDAVAVIRPDGSSYPLTRTGHDHLRRRTPGRAGVPRSLDTRSGSP